MLQDVQIALNKSKLIGLFFACLGFVAAGLWFVISPPVIEDSLLGNKVFLAVIGSASVVLFLLMAYFIGKKIPDPSPGMVISTKGVLDNSSSNAVGFIGWEDIAEIKSKLIGTQRFILLVVNDPTKFIEKEKRTLLKSAFKYNTKRYGTPIAISAVSLTMSTNEVIDLLNKYLRDYKNRSDVTI